MNILLFSLGGFFTGFYLNRWTEKRTGGHSPVLFLPVLCSFFCISSHTVTDSLFCIAMVVAAVTDHYSTEIPDRCSLVILICSLVHGFSMEGLLSMSWMVPVALAGYLGWGDVKLMLSAGAYLGTGSIVAALMISFWSATLAELIKKNRRKQIPLGPWLATGCLISLYCGDFLFSLFIGQRIPF